LNPIRSDVKYFGNYSCLSSVEDSVTLRNEGSTSVTPVPPKVVGLAPVRCTPGRNLLGCKKDNEGKENKDSQKLEHFEVRFGLKIRK
jgi:hypothetical protein